MWPFSVSQAEQWTLRQSNPQSLRSTERHLLVLAEQLGERNDTHDKAYASLLAAEVYIAGALDYLGLPTWRQPLVSMPSRRIVHNVVAELRGLQRPDEVVVVGAHYDSVHGGPGANDNGSGMAVLLAVAEQLQAEALGRTLRFVAFVNEEPPHTRKQTMGSLVYAKRCRAQREQVTAMLSLETIGTPGVHSLGVVGNLRSRGLAADVAAQFGHHGDVRARKVVLPGMLPGVNSSDHWSFWKCGYRAVMLTDGGPLRYRHYHRATDTVDRVDIDKLERVAQRVTSVLRALCSP
jgi:hypothetical protein